MDQLSRLQSDFDELQRKFNEQSGTAGQRTELGAVSTIDFKPVAVPPAAPAADQQLRNGDGSHSVNTWKDTVAAPGTDKVLECAYWFSSAGPAALGQVLDVTTDSETSSINDTLKSVGHSTYNAARCDWDAAHGVIRMTGLSTLNAPLSGDPVFPGRTEYFGARIARRNSTIVIQDDTHIAAMLYNNTPGAEDFMQSGIAFHLDGAVRGVPTGITQRKYKVLAKTDRGYEFLSDELDRADAPNDASFGSNVDVFLEWSRIDGVLSYEVYRHDISAGKYRRLKTITSGSNTYGDNNSIEKDDVGSYPPASDNRVKCYVATVTGALSNLAIDGVSVEWDDLFLNIPVPTPLLSAASGKQIFRLQMTKAMDRQMADATSTATSTTVGSATGEFTAVDTGRVATLYAADGVTVLHGPEAITYVDATHVTFATAVATTNADAVLYIDGGGDHGLLIDVLHLSYIERARYSSWPEDRTRTLSPTAVPNTSGQGGVGSGGDSGDPGDGGLGGCVEISTPVATLFGNNCLSMPFSAVRRGQVLRSGNLFPNIVNDIVLSDCENLYIVRTANRLELPCSEGQVLFASMIDTRGTPVSRLQVGDFILTCFDGVDACSPITEIRATGKRARVGTFSLGPDHRYFAGRLVLPWWKRLMRRLQGRQGACAIAVHNLKPLDGGANPL